MKPIRTSIAPVLSAAMVISLVAVAVRAQPPTPKFLKAVAAAPKSVQTGKPFPVTVTVSIDSPYHIQANPSKEGYIQTELEMGALKGFKFDKVVYPRAMETTMGGERLPVYEGKIEIRADVTLDRSVKPGKYTVPITLKYQGCNEQVCYPPATVVMKQVITVVSGSAPQGVPKK